MIADRVSDRGPRQRLLMFVSTMQLSGTERNLVSMLPGLEAEGPEVTVCTMTTRFDSPLAEELAATGIRRVDLRARRLLDPHAFRRFLALTRSGRFDLVHAQDQYSSIYTGLARRLVGIPTVMSRHTLRDPADTAKEKVRTRWGVLAARRGADTVLCVSDAVRRELSQVAKIPLGRLRTVYNGIEIERFEAVAGSRESKRAELGWSPSEPVVLMVAVLRRGKGHEVLFDAIPKVRAQHPDARFVLVGDGELSVTLREAAQPLGPAVDFLGERVDVPELLAASDLLVLPSWSEALPTVLLEAGAAALPVVTTDAGGAPEIVIEGETGFVVPRGDSSRLAARIAEALEDRSLAREMGARGHQRVREHFSLEAQASNTVDLYRELLARRARPL